MSTLPDICAEACPVDPVVRLDDASLDAGPYYEAGLASATFALRRGELALVRLPQGLWDHPLADLVAGLVLPDRGEVEAFGAPWSRRSPAHAALLRGRMGRVFEGHGWLSNLDVDENITLAQRHAARRPVAAIVEEARGWAAMAGLDGLPPARPAHVPHETLRRCAWVRASLGAPWLVVLERPGRDLADGWIDPLVRMIDTLRARGTAVLWIGGDEEARRCDALNPSLKMRVEGNTLHEEN